MNTWDEMLIDEMCLKVTDGSHFSPDGKQSGYPMVSVKDMEDNGFNLSNAKFICESDYKKLVKSDCKPLENDVLIAKDGSYLKHVFVCKKDMDIVILSSIAILRPNLKIINPYFFKYLLKSPTVKGMMSNYVSGSALPRIILDAFKKMKLSIPPLLTQQKIADILSAYDDLIENNNLRIGLLEQAAQQLYKEWFVRFRFPGYETTHFTKGIPDGWEVVQLGKLYKTISGGTPSRGIKEYYIDGVYPWIKTGELNDRFVIETEEKITQMALKKSAANLFQKGSLLMAMYGATIGRLGFAVEQSACNQACCVFNPLKAECSNEYLYYALLINREYIISLAVGAAQQNLSQDSIKKIKILKPTQLILKQFNEKVKIIHEQLKMLQIKNQNLIKQRDLLLPRLMSGKLEV